MKFTLWNLSASWEWAAITFWYKASNYKWEWQPMKYPPSQHFPQDIIISALSSFQSNYFNKEELSPCQKERAWFRIGKFGQQSPFMRDKPQYFTVAEGNRYFTISENQYTHSTWFNPKFIHIELILNLKQTKQLITTIYYTFHVIMNIKLKLSSSTTEPQYMDIIVTSWLLDRTFFPHLTTYDVSVELLI